jgi:outer membrane protein assembly factor BamD (BamD/ComL family)
MISRESYDTIVAALERAHGLAEEPQEIAAIRQATDELKTAYHAQLPDATQKRAKKIVKAILTDLEDRSGFDGWWDDIEGPTRTEIRRKLTGIVVAELGR